MNARYASQIQRCESQLQDFFAGISPRASSDLSQRFMPDKWSVLENMAHLGRYHEIFLERINRILSEDKPVLARYKAEEDPEWKSWRSQPYSDLNGRIVRLREQLVRKLKSLDESDFERTGIHPSFGEMPLSQWLEFFLVHEGHHLYLIFQQVRMHRT